MNSPIPSNEPGNQPEGLPSIAQMSEELERALFGSDSGPYIVVASDLTTTGGSGAFSLISREFHSAGLTTDMWEAFKRCAVCVHGQGEDLNVFARTFIDLATVAQHKSFSSEIARLVEKAVEFPINVQHYLAIVRSRLALDRGEYEVTTVAHATLSCLAKGLTHFDIEFEARAAEKLREFIADPERLASVLDLGTNKSSDISFRHLVEPLSGASEMPEIRPFIVDAYIDNAGDAARLVAAMHAYSRALDNTSPNNSSFVSGLLLEALPKLKEAGLDPLLIVEDVGFFVDSSRNEAYWMRYIERDAFYKEHEIEISSFPVLRSPSGAEAGEAHLVYTELGKTLASFSYGTGTKGYHALIVSSIVEIFEDNMSLGRNTPFELRELSQRIERSTELLQNFPVQGRRTLFAQTLHKTTSVLQNLYDKEGLDFSHLNEWVGHLLEKVPTGERRQLFVALEKAMHWHADNGQSFEYAVSQIKAFVDLREATRRYSSESLRYSDLARVIEDLVDRNLPLVGLHPWFVPQVADVLRGRSNAKEEVLKTQELLLKVHAAGFSAEERFYVDPRVYEYVDFCRRCHIPTTMWDATDEEISQITASSTENSPLIQKAKMQLAEPYLEVFEARYRAEGRDLSPAVRGLISLFRVTTDLTKRPAEPRPTQLDEILMRSLHKQLSVNGDIDRLILRFGRYPLLEPEENWFENLEKHQQWFLDEGLPIEFVTHKIVNLGAPEGLDEFDKAQLLGAFRLLSERVSEESDISTQLSFCDELSQSICTLLDLNTGQYAYDKVKGALRDMPKLEVSFLREQSLQLTTQRAMSLLLHKSEDDERSELETKLVERAKEVLNGIIADSPPYILSIGSELSPEALQSLQETHQVLSFGLDVSMGGFSTYRFPATRIGAKPAEIAQFGQESGAEVHAINGANLGVSPGRGYRIRGLQPDALFVPDPDTDQFGRPTFSQYYRAWSYGKAIDDLPMTDWWFTRTMITVSGPRDDRHTLKGDHFSLVIVNPQPIGHYKAEMLYLVSTDVWKSLFSGSLIPLDEYEGPDSRYRDVTRRGITVDTLYAESLRQGKPIFNLGWADNYTGTLVNAGQPQMAPYHEWERERQRETTTKFGHVHKSHILGPYQVQMHVLQEAVAPLQEGHRELRDLTGAYRDKILVWQQARANWHLGHTRVVGGSFDDEDSVEDDTLEMIEDGEFSVEESLGPYSGRMLWYAYDWHDHFLEHGETRTFRPPVLYRTTRNRWGAAVEPVLDTRDMTIFDGGSALELPVSYSNGRGDAELEMYRDLVLRKIGPNEDLRFLDRSLAGLD